MTTLRLLALGALLLAGCNVEQPMRWEETAQIELDLLMVQMPEPLALPLISELRNRKTSAKGANDVLQLVKDGNGTLVGWPFLTTKSGHRAVVEQIDEIRYATEYEAPGETTGTKRVPLKSDQPGIPNAPTNSGDAQSGNAGQPGTTGGKQEESPAAEEKAGSIIETTTFISDGMPASFETRNAGVTFEVEPVLRADRRTIDINLAPRHVRFLGMSKKEIGIEGSDEKAIVEQPHFLANKVTTAIQMADGEHALLGVFKVPDRPGTVELMILHTRIKKIEVPVGRAKTLLSPGDPPPPPTGAGLGP